MAARSIHVMEKSAIGRLKSRPLVWRNLSRTLPQGRFSGLLAPEAERFLRGTVGVAEENAIGVGAEAVRGPGGHYEDVVRGKGEADVVDVHAPAALGHVE